MDEDSPEFSPERREQVIAAINRMGDKLVRLGLANSVICNNATGDLRVSYTARGLVLQEEISHIFDAVTTGETFSFDELQAFMIILSVKP